MCLAKRLVYLSSFKMEKTSKEGGSLKRIVDLAPDTSHHSFWICWLHNNYLLSDHPCKMGNKMTRGRVLIRLK